MAVDSETKNSNGSTIIEDFDSRKKVPEPHKVILSHETSDKILYIPKECSYVEFLDKIAVLYPQLENNFSLISGGFKRLDEEFFTKMKHSNAAETWFLVQKNKNGSEDEANHAILKKPCYELLKYDVHPNALTQSGSYHFSASYQAFCEFIDNAIQATMKNTEEVGREIKVHIFLKQGIACVFDNGEGMTSEGLKAFASYFLSQEDRGLEPGTSTTYGYMDGFISKFGVGATQAGFYLGETIKVVTKMKESPFVNEITISKEKLHERAKNNAPVFEDYKCFRNPGDQSTLDPTEAACLAKLVKEEPKYEHFSCIIIKDLHEKHLKYLHADQCSGLSRDIAHVYHYYMHGIRGRLKKLEFERINLKNFAEDDKPNVSIQMVVDKGNGPPKVYNLTEVKDDLESQYQMKLKAVFPFSLELKIPEMEEAQVVQGCLMYFPNESGEESLPSNKTCEGEDGKPDPMFECFWQGRLAPLSYVNRLTFCAKPESRTRKQRDKLPDICYDRVRGLLFFNRHTPISNNKLKILLDTRRDLSDAMSDAATSRALPKYFQQWLEQCHREFDKEFVYEHPLPNAQQPKDGNIFYGQLRVIHSSGEDKYLSGDHIKIDTRPVAYGKAMYFIKKGNVNELDEIVYCRLPEEVYGNIDTRPVTRLAGKPVQSILDKIFAADLLLLPQELKIHEASIPDKEVPDYMTFHTGEKMKERTNFWVTVYNGEKPPKAITELNQKKIGVKVEVSQDVGIKPIINQVPIDRRFGFKPFYLDQVGTFDVKFTAFLANKPCGIKKILKMKILPNVAEIFNLVENSPDLVQLGEPVINFSLSFHDVYENNTSLFKDGDTIKITCKCDNMVVKGLHESYKPNEDGILQITGISVEPCGTQLSLSRDYEFWVFAEGIGDVMFPFRLLTGVPERVQTTQLATDTFENYENFPEFEVRIVDKYGQPSMVKDKSLRLALSCKAFSRVILISKIANGKAKFPSTPIRMENLKGAVTEKVFISLVEPEPQKKKCIIKRTIKEFTSFQIVIKPSNICQSIRIVQVDADKENVYSENFLGIESVAGGKVTHLKVVAFGENGEKLSDDRFMAQEPRFTCTWTEHIDTVKLPSLPDFHVSNVIQVNMHSVHCFFEYNGFEIRKEAKLKVSVASGEAVKWSFVLHKSSISCDQLEGLTNALGVVCLDKHHNTAKPSPNVKPSVTVEHSVAGKAVHFTGGLELSDDGYRFSSNSILRGSGGKVSLFVQDESNILAKDSATLKLLPSSPHSIFCNSTAFEKKKGDANPWMFVFLDQPISSHIMCHVIDKYNNQFVELDKLSMTLEWHPPNTGTKVTKKGASKGEVIFPAKYIKCISNAAVVKMKVSCPDMKDLLPFWVNVKLLQCNRVTSLRLEVSDENLMATSGYPMIKVWHETEDGVHVSEVLSKLKLIFYKPSAKTVDVEVVYPISKRKVIDGVATYEPNSEHIMMESGLWNVRCQYTETREQIKQANNETTTSSNNINLKVSPGLTTNFKLNLPTDTVLNASNTADPNARILMPPQAKALSVPNKVELTATDNCGNLTEHDATIFLKIESAGAEKDLRKDLVLPQLEIACQQFRMKGGKLILPRISLREKVGNDLGYYYLVFTDRKNEPCKIKFSFSTDAEVEKINQAMLPLKADLEKYQRRFKEKQEAYRSKKIELCSHTVQLKKISSDPNIREIDNQLSEIRNEIDKLQMIQNGLRACQKENNYPPHNVRQYIKGLVCELAYVSEPNHCRILSWFAQTKMRVALCETRGQQKKVYDMGCPAYSLNLMFPYHKRGFDPMKEDLLPIDLPDPPKGFQSPIDLAVNLLEFKRENKHLRSTLFWSIFQRTIVVKDIEHAQKYREHVIKLKVSCPAILTSFGDLLAADGLMDPGRRCPPSLENLRYTFGELPPLERAEFCNMKSDREKLEALRQVAVELNMLDKEVKQSQLDLSKKQKQIAPLIKEHEEKLNCVKRKAEKLQTETSNVKKRKT